MHNPVKKLRSVGRWIISLVTLLGTWTTNVLYFPFFFSYRQNLEQEIIQKIAVKANQRYADKKEFKDKLDLNTTFVRAEIHQKTQNIQKEIDGINRKVLEIQAQLMEIKINQVPKLDCVLSTQNTYEIETQKIRYRKFEANTHLELEKIAKIVKTDQAEFEKKIGERYMVDNKERTQNIQKLVKKVNDAEGTFVDFHEIWAQTIPKIERLEDKLDIIMMGKVDVLENDVEQLKNQNGEMVSLVCELDERIKSIKRAVENTIDILTDSFNN